MASVQDMFFVASVFVSMASYALLYAINNDLFPGYIDKSLNSMTLLNGLLAALSAILVVPIFVFMGMRAPLGEDNFAPGFLAEAEANSNEMQENSSETSEEEEEEEEEE